MNNSTHFKVEFSTNSPSVTRISWDLAIFVLAFLGVNILVQRLVMLACCLCFEGDEIFVKFLTIFWPTSL